MWNARAANLIFFYACMATLLSSCQFEPPVSSNTLYQKISSQTSGITFKNDLTETEDFNIIEYLYFYNGGGVAVGDINNDGLPDIYLTANQLPNKLYLNKGNFQFEDITAQAGVAGTGDWKTGVTMADVNGDGWLDVYVCQLGNYKGLSGRNELFINNQDGTFSEQAEEYGLAFRGFSTQAAFFDYDLDGDLDMFLLNHSVHSTENYADIRIRSVRDSLTGDRLYRNDGNTFTDVTYEAGIISSKIGFGLGITVSDVDGNGCPDIYISNDFHENDYLYYNNCDGTFRESILQSVGHTSTFSMGNDIADLNNDGRPDILSLDMKPDDETILKSSVGADPYNIYQYKLSYGYHYQFPHNALQLNQGSLFGADVQFSEISQLAGVAATDWSWAVLAHDMNNDGWKDIFITNGIWRRPNDLDYLKFISNQQIQQDASDLEMARKMPPGQVANYAFANTENLVFKNVSAEWGLAEVGCANGAAYADFDNDGDLDLIINNLNAEASLFENKTTEQQGNHFLKIKLQGEDKNTFGIGTKVRLWQHGQMQLQEQSPTRGFQSSVDYGLHFGLGQNPHIDSLQVIWPNGKVQFLTTIPVDTTLLLKQTDAQPASSNPYPSTVRRFLSPSSGFPFQHQENTFTDFDQEKLLPKMLSKEGPKLAVGDVNGDGLDDVFIGGAMGQAGALMIQQPNGSFLSTSIQTFAADVLCEDVDATFFDADGDGDLDLYVVSGGGQVIQSGENLQDRLYLNDGNGEFSKASLPKFLANGSCVVAADFNQDGAVDVFVGSRSIPGNYGKTPESYLLLNNGKGNFTAAAASNLAKVGMVTDAVWLEAARQLVIVGEWMPVTIFTFGEREVTKTELPNSSGWWNTVTAADMDNDGDEDLLLGNWGWNSDLQASPEETVGLYIHDFDDNGSIDPILTYYKYGKPYTYASKDELIGQIVSLRKQYLDYAKFAKSTLPEIFRQQDLEKAQYKEVQTLSSLYAENLGNGSFKLHPLPQQAQVAPIFAFTIADYTGDGQLDVLAAGNQYDTQPALGKMDASYGCFLKGDGNGSFQYIEPLQSGFAVQGQVRDMKSLQRADGRKIILVGRNDAEVVVFDTAY